MSENYAAKRIADAIRSEYIISSTAKVGERLPSVRELSAKYAASGHTIVHALGMLVDSGFATKRRGSGYYVADGGTDLKLSRSLDVRTLGLILPDSRSEIMTRIYGGVERACAARDWSLMIVSSGQDYDSERMCLEKLRADNCRGVVIYPATRTREQMNHDYLRKEYGDFPIALIDLACPVQKHIQVIFDNRRLGREMTEVLLKQGHRRIAFTDFRDKDVHKSTHDRYSGYLDAISAAGLTALCTDRWIIRRMPDKGSPELIAPALINWMQSKDRPTALIALDDSVAVEIITVANELGISVPEDLEIVGFDNLRDGMACNALTWTSNPDFARAGEMATELLLEQIISGTDSSSFAYVLPVPVKKCRSQLLTERCRNAIERSCEDFGLSMQQLTDVR